MYIKRHLQKKFQTALNTFPAVLISGPRQSGKTTFLKNELNPDTPYVSFDNTLERMYANEDPVGFINNYEGKTVILDEIQYVPDLLPYIKRDIQKNRQDYGKWILTTSLQSDLLNNFKESLSNCIALLSLFPFHTMENIFLEGQSLEKRIWQGGYPDNILYSKKRDVWFSNYIQTLIERDIRQLIQVQDLSTFQTFLGLCASMNGLELNMASLSRQIGITKPTCKKWISILSASFIVLLVKPYYQNFKKRLIKSPKLYFLDQAMAVYLTRQPDPMSMFNGAMGSAFFEGFIVTEVYKTFISNNKNAACYFWRSHDGLIVDLIIDINGKTWPIEIKKIATPLPKHTQSLIKFEKLANNVNIGSAKFVCTVKDKLIISDGIEAVPWLEFITSALTS